MLDINLRGNLRAFRAAAYGIFLTLTPFLLSAQSIYITPHKFEADVRVFVTKYKSDADVIVYKAVYEFDAKGNEGRWYFVDYEFESYKLVFFTKYRSLADVKVYYTPYKSHARWVNQKKRELFH